MEHLLHTRHCCSTLLASTNLILVIPLWGLRCSYPCFTMKKPKLREGKKFDQGYPIFHGSAGIKILKSGSLEFKYLFVTLYILPSPQRAWSINFQTHSNSLQAMILLSLYCVYVFLIENKDWRKVHAALNMIYFDGW